jgi:hypothetical protein
MINWWGLFRNALWVVGLAVGLGALSIANYQAHRRKVRLRQTLAEPGFQLAFRIGMTAFCLGLLFSSRTWWEQVVWGLLALPWLWWPGHAKPLPVKATPRLPQRTRLGWVLILAGLLMIGGWGAITGVQLLNRVRSLQDHLQVLEGLAREAAGGAEPATLRTAGKHLTGMHQDLEAIQSRIGPLLPAGRLLRWLPRYGGDLAAASDLLDMAVGVASAGDRTFQALLPAFDLFSDSRTGPSPTRFIGERILPVLVAAQPELQAAQSELAAAKEARARSDLQTFSPHVSSLLERLDRYRPWFETAVDGALLAPGLLGADGPRTYLIIAQNNHELRATGGFISGVGEARTEEGRLSLLSFDDSYAVDSLQVPHELTPQDFQRVLGGQLWFFRDANWDADFPTSAQRALEIYAGDRGVKGHGVLTLDLSALQLLVDAVGPLHVEGISDPVTQDNVQQVVQAKWAQPTTGSDQEWYMHRKDFMGQIASAAMDRLIAGQDVEPLKLARALKRALDEKHILIYLADPQAASLLRQQNWDGALTTPLSPSDSLLVVDSNVGFNKVDAVIARSISYEVDLAAETGPRARLTLTYQHLENRPLGACIQESRHSDTYAEMMERCYWDYVRVYVPAGSQLQQGPDLPLPPGSLLARSTNDVPPGPISPTLTEDSWSVWAVFFDLTTLEQQTLTFEYQLPAAVAEYDLDGCARYRLQVQKQPGTEAVPLRVEVTLPPGAKLVATTPMGLPALETDLRTDRQFEVVYCERETGP